MQVELVKIDEGDYIHTFKLFHIEIYGKEYCVAEERLDNYIIEQIEDGHYHFVEEIDDRYSYVVPQEIADTEIENEIIESIKSIIDVDNLDFLDNQKNIDDEDLYIYDSVFGTIQQLESISVNENTIVIVYNLKQPTICLYNGDNIPSNERLSFVENKLNELAKGCIYTYKVIKQIGNTFLCN
jgi:hypothetical protein